MVTVGMSYRVRPGKEEDFEKVFQAVQRALQDTPDHLETHLYRECGESDYLIVSEWTQQKAFEEFASSTLFQKVMAWGESEVFRARPKHQIYETLESSSPKRPRPSRSIDPWQPRRSTPRSFSTP